MVSLIGWERNVMGKSRNQMFDMVSKLFRVSLLQLFLGIKI